VYTNSQQCRSKKDDDSQSIRIIDWCQNNLAAVYQSPSLSASDVHDNICQYILPATTWSPLTVFLGDFNMDARKTTMPDLTQHVTIGAHTDGAILYHVYWTGHNLESHLN